MADILVIDDDKKLVSMLSRVLVYEGYSVETALTGADGLKQAIDASPNVIILDWMLPEMDGLEVCRRLRRLSDVPILMLTAKDAVADRVAGLKEGADDYLVKPFAIEELVARIEVLLRRQDPGKSERYQFADLTLDAATRMANRGDRSIELSTTEYELLLLFMSRPNQVLTRDIIMERVWGYDFQGESNVLEVYIGYLRRKLESVGEPRLIHTVRGAGYILRDPK